MFHTVKNCVIWSPTFARPPQRKKKTELNLLLYSVAGFKKNVQTVCYILLWIRWESLDVLHFYSSTSKFYFHTIHSHYPVNSTNTKEEYFPEFFYSVTCGIEPSSSHTPKEPTKTPHKASYAFIAKYLKPKGNLWQNPMWGPTPPQWR